MSTQPLFRLMPRPVQVDPPLRSLAAAIYTEAFHPKLETALGTPDQAARILAARLDLNHSVCIQAEETAELVALAGFCTPQGQMIHLDYDDLRLEHGPMSALWRLAVLAPLDRRPVPDVLQLDGIAVAPAWRGQGLGSRLIRAVKGVARELGLNGVQLDVVDTNVGARRLYERHGFKPVMEKSLGWMGRLYGFQKATTMRWDRRPDAVAE